MVRDDVRAGDAIVREVVGVAPARLPHPALRHLPAGPSAAISCTAVLAELGYRFSTSTVPAYGMRYGPGLRPLRPTRAAGQRPRHVAVRDPRHLGVLRGPRPRPHARPTSATRPKRLASAHTAAGPGPDQHLRRPQPHRRRGRLLRGHRGARRSGASRSATTKSWRRHRGERCRRRPALPLGRGLRRRPRRRRAPRARIWRRGLALPREPALAASTCARSSPSATRRGARLAPASRAGRSAVARRRPSVVLLYPDSIGVGFGAFERRLGRARRRAR